MGKALTGKTALITGSTSGIGLGIARAFAQAGADVMLNGFGDASEIEKTRAGIAAEFAVKTAYSPADMGKPAEITAMIAEAETVLGRLDILVNNAGIQFVSPVEEFPPEKWDAIIAINLSSVFHATRAALPGMRKRGWGRVINIASAHGLVASPNKSAYVAAKHGVVGFTKSIALELAEAGITANSICPGFVLTPLVEKQIVDLMAQKNLPRETVVRDVLLAPQPTKTFVQIDQVAALALFLASDAAQAITGSAYSIDGGWTAR
ncbi:MAG TPA: 3-hydroxybutyrate dehydrogenase [Usitatibacteraceae bacterium]|nr:3-hydroxybutyrate dehydrogenase [Usitatibacteraceae bacterium]